MLLKHLRRSLPPVIQISIQTTTDVAGLSKLKTVNKLFFKSKNSKLKHVVTTLRFVNVHCDITFRYFYYIIFALTQSKGVKN